MGESVLTAAGFERVDGAMHCEAVALESIAAAVGTPCYVYSLGDLRHRYAVLTEGLRGIDVRVHYSVKANSNGALLRELQSLGAGVDIVSEGELRRALAAGFHGRDVVFSGVGKTDPELEAALRAGVKTLNVESIAELHALHEVATRMNVVAPVALRVNPDVSVETPHKYTRTGERGMKFGIPDDQVLDVVHSMRKLPHIRLVGIAAHLGSQIAQAGPYAKMTARLEELVAQIGETGVGPLEFLDIGGGFSVPYDDEPAFDLDAYAAALRPFAKRVGLPLIIEPGRYLIARAGVLLTRVVYRKHSGGKEIVITDAGMSDLIRPSLYDAYHQIEAVADTSEHVTADVVGPICESGDFFGLNRDVANVQRGDLLVVRTAGAYGFVMTSNYNSRRRPAEVVVDGARFAVATRRETYEDVVQCEVQPLSWSDG